MLSERFLGSPEDPLSSVRDRVVKAIKKTYGDSSIPVLFYFVVHDLKGGGWKKDQVFEDRLRVKPHLHGAIALPFEWGADLVTALEREIAREVAKKYTGRGASRAVKISDVYKAAGDDQERPVDRGWPGYIFTGSGYLGGRTYISTDLKGKTRELWEELRGAI